MNSSSTRLCVQYLLSQSQNTDPSQWDRTSDLLVCIINAVLIIPTVALNLFVILSITRTPSLRKPSHALICLLAFTDFGVGVLVQPLYIARKVLAMRGDYEQFCVILQTGDVVSHVVCVPSFFIITATSVDRYLAVTSGRRYRSLVTNTRVLLVGLASLLFAGIVLGIRVLANREKYMVIAAVLMFFCLSIIIFCYVRAVTALKTAQFGRKFNVTHYKRALVTLAIVTGVLFFCYVPFVGSVLAIAVHGRTRRLNAARELTTTLLFMNSFLTPALYGWRSRELRSACAGILGVKMSPSQANLQTELSTVAENNAK
ncbi:histamine H2 receptor-like [Nematostella vectensis]|uniref:histamine H2 receptor-like n=1 Tax=Nematostella vectensis TaxID=45351 RepID=UPI0013900848|nr:histamine H2 receptor-like [Nematostella vectensis]